MNILNIVNFVRAVEPRNPSFDLVLPVQKQLQLVKQHKLPATFLLQYDALIDSRFTDLFKTDNNIEIGVWLEVVQPLVEAVGIKWRGREGFSWDWHSDVGFTVGYTPEERIKIADELMRKFFEVFGYYPKSVGSWLIDAVTLNYLKEKYDITASCNCKDQWGTDGYSLWGGYYNQAYYPSKYNVLCPASGGENQINVPVFRMLGSDPIDQYDLGIGSMQTVISLEPVYPESGGNKKWIDWFLGEIFGSHSISFGYAQAGQENSFGWDCMKDGLTYQFSAFEKLRSEGKISVLTLAEAGKWYSNTYQRTPVSVVAAKNGSKQSVWYCSKKYRLNFCIKDGVARIRDMFYFDEFYRERYLTDTCKSENMYYDNLPMVDGNKWSVETDLAGIYFERGGKVLSCPVFAEISENGDTAALDFSIENSNIKIECFSESVKIHTEFNLLFKYKREKADAEISVESGCIRYKHNGFLYALEVSGAQITDNGEIIKIVPKNGVLKFTFKTIK